MREKTENKEIMSLLSQAVIMMIRKQAGEGLEKLWWLNYPSSQLVIKPSVLRLRRSLKEV